MLLISTTLTLSGCATFKAVNSGVDDIGEGNIIKGSLEILLLAPVVTMLDILSFGAMSKAVEDDARSAKFGAATQAASSPEMVEPDNSTDAAIGMLGTALDAAARAGAQKSARLQQLQQQRALQRQQTAALQQQQLQLSETQRQQRVAQQQTDLQRLQQLTETQRQANLQAQAQQAKVLAQRPAPATTPKPTPVVRYSLREDYREDYSVGTRTPQGVVSNPGIYTIYVINTGNVDLSCSITMQYQYFSVGRTQTDSTTRTVTVGVGRTGDTSVQGVGGRTGNSARANCTGR